MCSIRLPSLTLLAIPKLSRRLDCEGGDFGPVWFLGRKRGVSGSSVLIEGRAGRGEDGCGIRPIEEPVKDDTEDGSERV